MFKRQLEDLDTIEDHLHDDYVEEYPQSSERIRGKHNWRSILQNYPGLTSFDYGFKLGGELGVAELIAEYDGERVYACETVELEDGKVKRVRHISASHSKHRSGERNGLKGCKLVGAYSPKYLEPVDWRFTMSEMTEEPGSNHNKDNLMARLRHRIYRYRVVFLAVGLFMIGLFFITLASFIPASEHDPWWSEASNHILRDLGIAALISALLGSAYEYWLRGDFVEDAKDGLRSVVTEERQYLKDEFAEDAQTGLRHVIEERDNRLRQLEQFRGAGLEGIHEALDSELLRKGFSEVIEKAHSNREDATTPPPRIRILDTWTDLGGWGIMDRIEEAASKGSRVQMLLLDPHSDQVKYRAEAMEKPADLVKVEILEELQTLCRISSRLGERDNHNLEVKVYDAAPTNHIYDFDGTILVGIYWRKIPSYRGPQIEIVAHGSERFSGIDLVGRINEQFEDLWEHSETHAADVVKKLSGDSGST